MTKGDHRTGEKSKEDYLNECVMMCSYTHPVLSDLEKAEDHILGRYVSITKGKASLFQLTQVTEKQQLCQAD